MTTTAQLDAILHGAAFAPITDRAFLRITGADATRWLNGMVTNNIKDLAPGEGNYNFLLNAQGRIQGDCTIYREPGDGPTTFLLATDNSQLETVQQTLDRFIIMDDVELSRALTDHSGWLVLGTEALGTLDLGFMWPPAPISLSYGVSLKANPLILGVGKDRYEIWSASDMSWLDGICHQVDSETLEAFRIYSGTPKYGVDIRNTDNAKDLPQETAQTHALHFAKGCYLGQEIVERIRSRGQVHRTFTRFTLTGALPTQLPALLTANDKPAGELTSATCIQDNQHGDTLYALGYLRREALNQPITYPGGTAHPRT